MSINSKKKGNLWENKWGNWLSGKGIKAWKDAQSGGGNREKSDVGNNIGFNFECKAVKKISLQEVWRQAEIASSKNHTIASAVIHFDGMPDNEWLVVMHSEDWVELFKKSLEPKTLKTENKNLQWKLRQLINAAKALLREVEKL